MRVERIVWDVSDKYYAKRLNNRTYLVCAEDSTCFLVHNAKSIDEATQAVEELAKAEFT
jgi:hypothetical protein